MKKLTSQAELKILQLERGSHQLVSNQLGLDSSLVGRYMVVSHAHVATLGLCYLTRYDLLATPYYGIS